MLKNILNLEGAQQLSKNEQSSISGGKDTNFCKDQSNYTVCGNNFVCCNGFCVEYQGSNTCIR